MSTQPFPSPRYRPKGPQDAGKLWLWILLKDGREIDAVMSNDLLHADFERGLLIEIRNGNGLHRQRTTIDITQVDAIVVRGVIGVPAMSGR